MGINRLDTKFFVSLYILPYVSLLSRSSQFHLLACGLGPRNECCCSEHSISEQENFFAVKQLDAHNNNIHFVAPIHMLDGNNINAYAYEKCVLLALWLSNFAAICIVPIESFTYMILQ